MWHLVEPKLAAEDAHFLETQLFQLSSNGARDSTRLIVGNRDFLDKFSYHADHSELVHKIELSRGNLCIFGTAIAEYSRKWAADEYWVQASPQFWSNINLGYVESGPKPKLDYWKAYTDEINAQNIVKNVRLFFDGVRIFLTPSKNKVVKERELIAKTSLKHLTYDVRSPQLWCLARDLRAAGIAQSQLVFVRHTDSVDMTSNAELVEEFDKCFTYSACSDQVRFLSEITVAGKDDEE